MYEACYETWDGSEESCLTKGEACLPKQNQFSPRKNEEPSGNCDVKNNVLQI